MTCKPLTNLYIHYLEANKINHFYVIRSNYIAIALKQPNLTLYVCCQPPFPHIPLELVLHSRGREKKGGWGQEGEKVPQFIKENIPFVQYFPLYRATVRGRRGGNDTQHNRKTKHPNLFVGFKKDFLIRNISTLLSEILGH